MCVMIDIDCSLNVSPQTNCNSWKLSFRYCVVHTFVPMLTLKLIQDLRRTLLRLHQEWEEEEEEEQVWEGSGPELPLVGLWGISLVTAEEDSE